MEEQLWDQRAEERQVRGKPMTVKYQFPWGCSTALPLFTLHPMTTRDSSAELGRMGLAWWHHDMKFKCIRHQTLAAISPKLENGRAARSQRDIQGGGCFQDLPVAWWVEGFEQMKAIPGSALSSSTQIMHKQGNKRDVFVPVLLETQRHCFGG